MCERVVKKLCAVRVALVFFTTTVEEPENTRSEREARLARYRLPKGYREWLQLWLPRRPSGKRCGMMSSCRCDAAPLAPEHTSYDLFLVP